MAGFDISIFDLNCQPNTFNYGQFNAGHKRNVVKKQ